MGSVLLTDTFLRFSLLQDTSVSPNREPFSHPPVPIPITSTRDGLYKDIITSNRVKNKIMSLEKKTATDNTPTL